MPRQKIRTYTEIDGQAVLLVPKLRGTIILDVDDQYILDDNWLAILAVKSVAPSVVVFTKRGSKRVGRLSRLLLQAPKGMNVDHINGNPLDNRKANLRFASSQQNNRNRAKTSRPKSSQYKGVSRDRNRWTAVIYSNYRQIYLGSFVNEVDAARAYDAKAREIFGEFAAVNFPLSSEQSALRPISKQFVHEAL